MVASLWTGFPCMSRSTGKPNLIKVSSSMWPFSTASRYNTLKCLINKSCLSCSSAWRKVAKIIWRHGADSAPLSSRPEAMKPARILSGEQLFCRTFGVQAIPSQMASLFLASRRSPGVSSINLLRSVFKAQHRFFSVLDPCDWLILRKGGQRSQGC